MYYLMQALLAMLFCHASFPFFLIIGLNFLIPVIIAQMSDPIAELVIPTGIPIKEAKLKIEIHLVIVENKIRKY